MKIYCPNKDYWFDLIVDENDDLLNEGAAAMVSPVYKIDLDTGKVKQGKIGTVTFEEYSFKSGIISHESVHCALAYLRIIKNKILELSDECDDNEEELAWLVGWFAKEITNLYYNHFF